MALQLPADGTPARTLRILLALPSESTIHFINFAGLATLASCFAIVAPAWSVFFVEGRYFTGTIFCVALVALTVLHLKATIQQTLSIDPNAGLFRAQLLQRSFDHLPSRLMAALRLRRREPIEPFPASRRSEGFRRFYAEQWATLMRGPCPPLYWSYNNLRPAAQTLGAPNSPGVLVSSGLIGLLRDSPETVRVYLAHEFGHIANRDLTVFAWTIGLARATRLLFITSYGALVVALWSFLDGGWQGALLLLVAAMWAVSLVVLWLLIARYAGVIISLRELYADVWALHALTAHREYDRALAQAAGGSLKATWQRVRSIFSLRLIHLSALERRRWLSDPQTLILPRTRYFALTALLLFLLECSPFTAGYGANAMRLSLLVAWPPFAVAYLANIARSVAGLALSGDVALWRRCLWTSIFLAIVLLLPVFHLPLVYADVLEWVVDRGPIARAFGGDWEQFTLQAAHMHPFLVASLSYAWLIIATRLARRSAGPSPDLSAFSGRVSRSVLRAAMVGVFVQSLFLFLLHYEPINDSRFDSVLAWWANLRGGTVLVPLAIIAATSGIELWWARPADVANDA
jgi:Zn-dependent protease with chaperone function